MTDDTPPAFLSPRILVPFLVVTLIWGTTWFVIQSQLTFVPPAWSVAYRFLVAGVAMLGVAFVAKAPLTLGRPEHVFCALLGIAQFAFNFNFVYQAERYITSGLVAVVFALLFLPNAVFARFALGQRMSGRLIMGSAIAVLGIILLFIDELRGDGSDQATTLTGIAFTLSGVVCASIANVMQATERARQMPMMTMLAWAMLWGAFFDACFAFVTSGPPIFDASPEYMFGLAYLGLVASALAFPLYFRNIRDIGPAKAAYSSVLIPIIAMAISTVFEGYRWSALAIAGSVVALAGMVVALSARKPST